MPRHEGRSPNAHRPIEIITGFHRNAEGSVLYRAGGTVVLCTASIDNSIPKWMNENDGGWLTAEYQTHPRANPDRRQNREGRDRPPKGRTHEIQRLVGRSLRSALRLDALGPRTISIDCDILEADGGTRTASITAGFVTTAIALYQLGLARVLRSQIAAISVGLVDDQVLVDLDYSEDSRAQMDMNVVATMDGELVEVQSTAEGAPIAREKFDALLNAALASIVEIGDQQRKALEAADMSLDPLLENRS